MPILDNMSLAGRVASGERHMALALTEPGAGSDAAHITTRAEAAPGGWRLVGEKTSITSASVADCAIVLAVAPGGITAFVVDLDETVARQRFKDPGNRPVGRGSLTFEGTFVPSSRRLSPEGSGFRQVMRLLDLSRPVIALMACGTAQRARHDGGLREGTLGLRAADLPVPGRQLRAGPERHADRADPRTGVSHPGTADGRAAHTRQAAMLKWWGPASAFQAIHECVILHGHFGWSEETPLQQMMRDVSGMEIGDGTPQIQKLVVAREMLGRAFVG